MNKPAFAFDGRNILPHDTMRSLGFEVHAIGKPEPVASGAGARGLEDEALLNVR